MLKKRTILILSMIFCLALSACSTPEQEVLSDIGSETETEVVTGMATGEETETAEPVLISDALDVTSANPKRSVKTFQDIASFLGRRIEKWSEVYRNVPLTEGDSDAVVEYVNLLVNEFGYEIVGTYHFDAVAADPFDGAFLDGTWEICLGLATVDTGREEDGQVVDAACDIDLYCKNGELKMWFTDLFHTEDFGYRWSGSEDDRMNEICGQRVLDAYYLENGRYRNGSDGALSVESGTHGEAIILVNGEEVLYSTDAAVHNEMYTDYDCDDYVIEIYDFIDGVEKECIEVTVPKTLMGGEVFTLSDGLGRRGDSPIWAIYSPGDGEVVRSSDTPTPRAAMNTCTVRILQWNDTECVVYIAMDIVTELEPMTLEVLAAMPAYGSLWGDTFKESEAVDLKVGDSLELVYNAPYVFMPNYETYEWKISSGQGASISGYGDTCTVTAVSKGEVIIKCVYSYGKDEPDVLTGISRNENHTKTELYYINIIP